MYESCSVDNDDAQSESGVHESTLSNSVYESNKSSSQQVDDADKGNVAPQHQSCMHADCLCPIFQHLLHFKS
jgi:hypothetical protein